jgi:hypothetical protein
MAVRVIVLAAASNSYRGVGFYVYEIAITWADDAVALVISRYQTSKLFELHAHADDLHGNNIFNV